MKDVVFSPLVTETWFAGVTVAAGQSHRPDVESAEELQRAVGALPDQISGAVHPPAA